MENVSCVGWEQPTIQRKYLDVAKEIIDKLEDYLKNRNSIDAIVLIRDVILSPSNLSRYGVEYSAFKEYYLKQVFQFSKQKYLPSLDYNQPSEDRKVSSIINNAHMQMKKGAFNTALWDLPAAGVFLYQNNGFFDSPISSFYTLFYIDIASEVRDFNNQSHFDDFKKLIEQLYNSEQFNLICNKIFIDLLYHKERAEKGELPEDNFFIDFILNRNHQPEKSIQESIDDAVREFNSKISNLVGLDSVKKELSTLIDFAKVSILKKKHGMKVIEPSKHLVFAGNPGTGKTTVARLIGEVYCSLGLLSKGNVIEVDRSALVGEYVGHTAVKTKKVIEQAKGGVLFIDEAYSLNVGHSNDFGSEAIETILKYMEDYRADLMVIAAGYPTQMESFISSNPGLESRFTTFINFPNYSVEELLLIFNNLAIEYDLIFDNLVKCKLAQIFTAKLAETNFGNARFVRNLFESTVKNQASRIIRNNYSLKKDLEFILDEDIPDFA